MKYQIIDDKTFLESKRWNPNYFTIKVDQADFETIKIGDLCSERKNALDPQAYQEQMFNYIGLENVESNTSMLVDFNPQPGKNIKSRSKIFKTEDILYGRLRPTLNKVYHITEYIREGICSTEFIVLIPNTEKVLPVFLRELLLSQFVQSKVSSLIAGAALPRINTSDLLNLNVPKVSIDKQKIIVDWVEKNRSIYMNYHNMCKILPSWINATIYNFLDNTEGSSLVDELPSYSHDILSVNKLPM
jgi:restriction endonuclease S subunit